MLRCVTVPRLNYASCLHNRARVSEPEAEQKTRVSANPKKLTHMNMHINTAAQEWTNRTLAVHERVNSRFLVLPGSLSIFTEITE